MTSDSRKLDQLIDLLTRANPTSLVGPAGRDGATGAVGQAGAAAPAGDHDLLTRLDTKVDQIQTDINALKDQGSKYITLPQHQELTDTVADHDIRVRGLESVAITKERQTEMENKASKLEGKVSNMWIYLTLYGVALGALYLLMVYHILHTN